jgi:P27 family predicted phage terminase small subunit
MVLNAKSDPATNAPDYLGEVAKEKWQEFMGKLADKSFDRDALAMLCSSWGTYRAALDNIEANGVAYTDSNGRVWNNPSVNTLDVAHRQIIKLSQILGLWDGGNNGDMPELPE